MATKTISVDLESYERLRRARTSLGESFSQVIKRAAWDDRRKTCGHLLAAGEDRGQYRAIHDGDGAARSRP